MAPWGAPEGIFSIPSLEILEIVAPVFTLDGRWDASTWRANFLAALPRLARLVLRAHSYEDAFTDSTDGRTPAAVAEALVTVRLPRAAVEAGRRLAVVLDHASDAGRLRGLWARFGWGHPAGRDGPV